MAHESLTGAHLSVAQALGKVSGPPEKAPGKPVEKTASDRVEFVARSGPFYRKIRERGCHDTGELAED